MLLFASQLGASPMGVGLVAGISAFTGVLFSLPAGLLSEVAGDDPLMVAEKRQANTDRWGRWAMPWLVRWGLCQRAFSLIS